MSAQNGDTPVGGGRRLDPTKPPFNLPGVKVLTYWDGHYMQQVVHIGAGTGGEPVTPVGGISRFTEAEAKARIESLGFLDLTGLRKSDHGIWGGKARKDGQAISVVLDVQGNIFFRTASR
jgi:hypothetical protein